MTSVRSALVHRFFEDQAMTRALHRDFGNELEARGRTLTASGWPSGFTQRRCVIDWATEPAPPKLILEAARLASRLNDTIHSAASQRWPTNDEVGFAGAFAAAALLAHADDSPELRDELLPLMKQAVLAGDADPQHFAHIHDRHRAEQSGTQDYGSLLVPDSTGEVHYLCPINDETAADACRFELGLPPLAAARLAWTARTKAGPFLTPYTAFDFLKLGLRLGIARLSVRRHATHGSR